MRATVRNHSDVERVPYAARALVFVALFAACREGPQQVDACTAPLSDVCGECPDLSTAYETALAEGWYAVALLRCGDGQALWTSTLSHRTTDYFDTEGRMVARERSSDGGFACDGDPYVSSMIYGQRPCDLGCVEVLHCEGVEGATGCIGIEQCADDL